MTIEHNLDNQLFTTAHEGNRAELAYTFPAEGIIDFTHTFVPENLRGQGVADKLAETGLAFARTNHLKVKTTCSFMAGFVQKHHDEYADLLA